MRLFVYDMSVNVNVIYYVHVYDMLVNVNVMYYVHVYDMLVNVNVIYYVHVCEQARWARSAGNSAIENLCIIIIITLQFSKTLLPSVSWYNCTRNVLWCHVHSSHIHTTHKTSLNYNSKYETSR